MVSRPTPGQANTYSMANTAPPHIRTYSQPTMVAVVTPVLRTTWRRRMFHSVRPLLRATVTYGLDISSKVAERTSWKMRPPWTIPRVSAGITMLAVSKRPEVGSQPSCTPSTRISSSPSQKFGTDSAATDSRFEVLSNGLRALAPATIPGTTPSTAAAPRPTMVR